MSKILGYAIMIPSGWLVLSPFLFGETNGPRVWVDVILGLCVIGLAFLSIKREADQRPATIIAGLGLLLALWGALISRLTGLSMGTSEIIVGLLMIVLGILVLPFQLKVSQTQFFNRNGGELATMTQIRMKNGDILAKATLLGAMPETIYMRPEEICKAIALMNSDIILSLPKILYQGWKINQKQIKQGDLAER